MGLIRALAVAMVLVVVAGCGGDSDGPSALPADGWAPVSIESALGTAVIEAPPQRVVTIGWGMDDIVYALGVVPVGIEHDSWAGDTDGYRPWFREAIEQAGAELPVTIPVLPEIDMDAIVELAPDLILAPHSGLAQADFDLLNELAPTVAYPERAWATPWDTQIELAGAALGKPAEAATLVEDIKQQFAEAAAAHPELAGHQFAYVYTAEPGVLDVYVGEDPRVEYLTRLGLVEAPELAAMEPAAGQFTVGLGLEQVDRLDDVDVLVTWFNDSQNQAEIEAQPLYARIPAVQRGSYVATLDRQLTMAVTMITPLSVPWSLDDYTGYLQDAVDHLD